MRTCWVLDHPAHVRLLTPFLREGTTADLIVACERPEVRTMLEQGDGRLPRRQTLWVPRPVGEGKRRKALYRIRSVQRFLCLLYTSPSPRDKRQSRMPSSA